MNQESLTTFNKISSEMEKLNKLMTKSESFKHQLQQALLRVSSSDSDQSGLQNISQYFKEYDNPTTKSLAFDEEIESNSRVQEGGSQASNTIYRNYQNQRSLEGDRENVHDDKSTVILSGLNRVQKKDHSQPQIPSGTNSIPNYSSLNHQKGFKKQTNYIKKKKVNSKNAIQSVPTDSYKSVQHHKSQNHFNKAGSLVKGHLKVDSPAIGNAKSKKGADIQHDGASTLKDIKGKLMKFQKIDREQLHKLQEKKQFKKTDLSSNRKKTKRGLGAAKSTVNIMSYGKMHFSSTKFTSKRGMANTSCKKFDSNRKQCPKREEKLMPNHQDWQRMEKTHKKLNRVNICKLQQNMKKAYDKKPTREPSANRLEKRAKKMAKYDSHHREHQQFKLHFTQDQVDSIMKKLIDQRQLNRQYLHETEKYLDAAMKMSKEYFQKLIKECRQTSEEAVLKLKLVTLILYFFDQFTSPSLLSNERFNPKADDFFGHVAEEQIILVLLHPRKLIKLIQSLPSTLMSDNIMSAERINIFRIRFAEINEQLDQELEFFLIKKEMIYHFVHSLSEYVNFLVQNELIAQTKRAKIIPLSSKEPLYGFYSSRSKREEGSNKYIKKNQSGNKIGFRCDSDRKITLEDDQICKEVPAKINRKESNGKMAQIKKLLK